MFSKIVRCSVRQLSGSRPNGTVFGHSELAGQDRDVERSGSLVQIEMQAGGFLRNQVRRSVGALVQVGSGKSSLSAFQSLLERPQLSSAGPMAPPHGLTLESVAYEGLDLMARNTL